MSNTRTYCIDVAVSRRVYGSVSIEATSLDDAVKGATLEYVKADFSPYGGGEDDFGDPFDIWLSQATWDPELDETEDGLGEGEIEKDVLNDFVSLSYLSCKDTILLLNALAMQQLADPSSDCLRLIELLNTQLEHVHPKPTPA